MRLLEKLSLITRGFYIESPVSDTPVSQRTGKKMPASVEALWMLQVNIHMSSVGLKSRRVSVLGDPFERDRCHITVTHDHLSEVVDAVVWAGKKVINREKNLTTRWVYRGRFVSLTFVVFPLWKFFGGLVRYGMIIERPERSAKPFLQTSTY